MTTERIAFRCGYVLVLTLCSWRIFLASLNLRRTEETNSTKHFTPASILPHDKKTAPKAPTRSLISPAPLRFNATTMLMAPPAWLRRRQQDDKEKRLLLLVVVLSAVGNRRKRDSIRRSWAGPDLKPPRVEVVFLLGRPREERRRNRNASTSGLGRSSSSTFDKQQKLELEQARFGDIIQVCFSLHLKKRNFHVCTFSLSVFLKEDFVDTYRNLTIKSLFLLKLASMPSFHFDFVLKTDDDVYINLKASSRLDAGCFLLSSLLFRRLSLKR